MMRSGLTSRTVRITSSNCVMSPRSTGAPIGTPPYGTAPGLRSMPTTVSPRATSRRMSRGPMKPVAPSTSTDMDASPRWGVIVSRSHDVGGERLQRLPVVGPVAEGDAQARAAEGAEGVHHPPRLLHRAAQVAGALGAPGASAEVALEH